MTIAVVNDENKLVQIENVLSCKTKKSSRYNAKKTADRLVRINARADK
jgi:hypothetical protein